MAISVFFGDLSDLNDLSDFEVIEVNTIVIDVKGSPDRKPDTWSQNILFWGDLSDFEVIEVNTIVTDINRPHSWPFSPMVWMVTLPWPLSRLDWTFGPYLGIDYVFADCEYPNFG
jgi:hypothetical protein